MDFGSAVATAHQKSICQNIKILIKILNIKKNVQAYCCTLWKETT